LIWADGAQLGPTDKRIFGARDDCAERADAAEGIFCDR